MIDPLERWREYGEKPDYAGLLTFAGMPYTQDAAELAGVDVAIVGAPTDDLVSDRPGHPLRPAGHPRAPPARPARTWRRASTPSQVLRVVDFGDAAVLPADPVRTHEAIEALVGAGGRRGRAAGDPRRRPLDRRARHPRDRAPARARRPDPLRHAHGHGRRGLRRRALARDDHVPARRAGPGGPDALRADRPARLLAGRDRVRLAARARHHVASSCTTCASVGIRDVIARAIAIVGDGPVFLSVDVDVLDPAFAPGHGTPEPGGMTSIDLLWACREIG